jgi:hypothetical protein
LRALIVVIVSEMSFKESFERVNRIDEDSFLIYSQSFLIFDFLFLGERMFEWRVQRVKNLFCSFQIKSQHCRIESRKDQSLSLKEE